ncbi:MAG: zinc ribbon domain-containing protein [Oscillospiraceae bacterium]|nr:zinc ribbon domain-containing protein [Oscillospiraceae bacterium]
MTFCRKCGIQLEENTKCPKCGHTVDVAPQENPPQKYIPSPPQGNAVNTPPPIPVYIIQPNLLLQLSSRIKTEGLIWMIIGLLQTVVIFGSFLFLAEYEGEKSIIILGVPFLIVGIINIGLAVDDFIYSKKVLADPVGIVQRYLPFGRLVGNIIYNVLFGGLIGVVGSFYRFSLRYFVISNAAQLQDIERKHLANRKTKGIQ